MRPHSERNPITLPIRNQPALVLNEIAHRFGRRWALRGVSLRAEPAEIVGIMGHNGSGKSTLLRVAATAFRPTRGSGAVFGADLVRDAQGVRANVSLLSTESGVYGDLSAFENLRFAARMLGAPSKPATLQHVLERVGLGHEGHELARNMSSGMQRRLSIARLLLREARLLLLDEPYNSLDPAGALLMNELIRETQNRGGAVLVVAHDLSRAAGLPDRVIEMSDGLLSDGLLSGGRLSDGLESDTDNRHAVTHDTSSPEELLNASESGVHAL